MEGGDNVAAGGVFKAIYDFYKEKFPTMDYVYLHPVQYDEMGNVAENCMLTVGIYDGQPLFECDIVNEPLFKNWLEGAQFSVDGGCGSFYVSDGCILGDESVSDPGDLTFCNGLSGYIQF